MAKGLLFLAVAILGISFFHPSVFGVNLAPGPGHEVPFLIEEPERPKAQKGDLDEIEERIKEMIQELERLQKEAAQKFRKDVLPRLQQELDKLRDWLRDLRLDKDGEPPTRST